MSGADAPSDGVDVDAALVRRLLAAQFPQWTHLPVERVDSAGVDNALYRLGDDKTVRLPRSPWSAEHIRKEQRWLPVFAPQLPLAIPTPLGKGTPGEGYPWHWSVYQWLDGRDAIDTPLADEHEAARALADFVGALHGIRTADGNRSGLHSGLRGVPLPVRDPVVRESIANLRGIVDVDAVTLAWENAIAVPAWRGAPVWTHGDLHPGNLLVQDGRIGAVIDWGLMSVGDPALDVMVAWTYLSASARVTFREHLVVDDDTWARGRGWALCVGVIAYAYYMRTNPVLAGFSKRAVDEVLADLQPAV
ncbi:aminoglycoside phosphotransferase family protein [Streptomyces roseolus]|uniref:aminoglycoside phosphotransferase family protein n=1 Tax=Streptomyces roseolus TaxID=67358 RepID=UPI001678AAA7|nr:aminoglycoside phosphotransferase family protein [Streptomyces roseolus]GGR63179.1 aminoglycoside phosphotransferase [Streptomyces roseolus]